VANQLGFDWTGRTVPKRMAASQGN
jgi:hypothetical protein